MHHLGVVIRVLAGLVVAMFALLACGNILRVLAYQDFTWWGVGGLSILLSLVVAASTGWLAFKLIGGAFAIPTVPHSHPSASE